MPITRVDPRTDVEKLEELSILTFIFEVVISRDRFIFVDSLEWRQGLCAQLARARDRL